MANVENILNPVQQRQLTAIKGTSRSLDRVQLQLATGKKVNSALDNPQNFFASRSLNNKAADLLRLLDGIGQNLRAVEVAQNGLEAAQDILDTAEAFLVNYLEKLIDKEDELQKLPVPPYSIETAADLPGYAGSQNSGAPVAFIQDGFILDNNQWRRFLINHTIIETDVLEFEFRSTNIPEIGAIGFDNDNSYLNNSEFFFLYGQQTNGITYSAPISTFQYDGSGDWVTVRIPVGEYFTGTFSRMVFVADDDGSGDDGDVAFRNISLGTPDYSVEAYEFFNTARDEYSKILDQLDMLVEDASYRGINLLKNDDMRSFFNEKGTSSLTTEGTDATSNGLGLEREDFTNRQAVERKIDQIRNARNDLRKYARTLTNDFATLRNRLDFTRSSVNTLKAGSDDLVLADQNEAGAQLLALQTRQAMQFSVLTAFQPSILNLLT